MTDQPRILVLGAGAVGSFLGGRLAHAGCAVSLVGRSPHVEVVSRSGLRLQTRGDATHLPVRTATAQVLDVQGPFDFILLTVKSFDTLEALEQLQPALGPATILGTFQNGIGNEEAIAAAVPDHGLLSGTLTLAVALQEPGVVVQQGRVGGVGLAPVSPEVNVAPLVRKFTEAGFSARRYSDFRAMKWSKLLLNILGNAQSAILDLPPQQIFSNTELLRYEQLAFREAVAVMERLRIPTVSLPGFPIPTLARIMALPPLLARLILAPRVAAARGNKMPSLWWDLQRKKGRTEARYLNGAVVDAGARCNVPTPVNSVLWAILEQVTSVPGEWDRYRRQPAKLAALLRTAARL